MVEEVGSVSSKWSVREQTFRGRGNAISCSRQRSAGFDSRAAGSGSATMARSSITRTPLMRSERARLTRIGRHGWPARRVVLSAQAVEFGSRTRVVEFPHGSVLEGIPITRAIANIDQGALGARHVAPGGGRLPPVSSAISVVPNPASASTRWLCCPRRGAGAASGPRSPS